MRLHCSSTSPFAHSCFLPFPSPVSKSASQGTHWPQTLSILGAQLVLPPVGGRQWRSQRTVAMTTALSKHSLDQQAAASEGGWPPEGPQMGQVLKGEGSYSPSALLGHAVPTRGPGAPPQASKSSAVALILLGAKLGLVRPHGETGSPGAQMPGPGWEPRAC